MGNIKFKLFFLPKAIILGFFLSFSFVENIQADEYSELISAEKDLFNKLGEEEAYNFIQANNLNLLISQANNQSIARLSALENKTNNEIDELEKESAETQSPSRLKEIRENLSNLYSQLSYIQRL